MATRERLEESARWDLRHGPLALRLYPDQILRQEATRVTRFDGHLDRFVRDMIILMKEHNGIGLAAPQVGVLKCIIVADIGNGPLKLVNPDIFFQEGSETREEGCLSLPDVYIDVPRSTRLLVAARDSRGLPVEYEAAGLLARVLLHEIDHLRGKLILDYSLDSSAKT